MNQALEFRGAYTAIVTPFTADGRGLDLARLREQAAFQARGGVRGIVVSGTTGESPTLEEHEYHELLACAVEVGRGAGLQVIAGTGSNSTAHASALQRAARSMGADAGLSVNPYYNKPTQEGLYRHFMAVADAADLPVMLYNIPGRTGVALTPETVERLAGHPNIRGVKEATGSTDSATEIASRCPGLALLSGDDSMTLPFASVGAVGVVSVVSNVAPGRVSELCGAFLGGDWARARAVHRALFPLCRAMFAETNPIPVKAAMRLLGRDSGVLRLPMTAARPETEAQLERALRGLGLWPAG
ncbi:MAG: 4-hydroxy-tetrahydrodipicolinate synthase [Phycisphaerae bacterium]|nr:4-hydroxy-tetrahydrodipicolinate synthase [Phycisphaerae bacterium]